MGTKPVKVGDKVKDFILESSSGKKINTADLKGKKILLSFHPLAWTGVCAKQMQSVDRNYDKFIALNTVPFGINIDSQPSKAAWAKELKLKHLDLLADFWPHGGVAADLGIFLEKFGFSGRVNIIIGENRKVEFIKIYPIPQLPEIAEVLKFLAKG
ncbi:MAG: redoxin domain-containing protein [bacterium]